MHVYASQFGLIGFLPDLSTTYRIHNSGIWQKKKSIAIFGFSNYCSQINKSKNTKRLLFKMAN